MNPTLLAAIDELTPTEERVMDAPVEPFGYGTDLRCRTDLTESMEETDPNSVEGLADAIVRRLDTARGTLPDDRDYGIDLRSYLNRGTTAAEIIALASQIRGELERDDRLAAVQVTVRPAPDGSELGVDLAVTPVDPRVGGFSLTLAVTSADIVLEELARS